MITTRPPKPVVVRHGGSAFMILNKNTCVNAVSSSVGRITTVIKVGMLGVPSAAVLRVPRRVPFPWRVPDYCRQGTGGFDHRHVALRANSASRVERLIVIDESPARACGNVPWGLVARRLAAG